MIMIFNEEEICCLRKSKSIFLRAEFRTNGSSSFGTQSGERSEVEGREHHDPLGESPMGLAFVICARQGDVRAPSFCSNSFSVQTNSFHVCLCKLKKKKEKLTKHKKHLMPSNLFFYLVKPSITLIALFYSHI